MSKPYNNDAKDSVLIPAPDVHSRTFDESVVLLDLRNGQYFALDETGARIWELVLEQITVIEIARRLSHEYEVELERAAQDVRAFIALLRERNLLIASGAT